MAPKLRLLTKSRFKTGSECPTKRYYSDRPEEFLNTKTGDKFLQALASGGFQVGALAQVQFPEGVEVTERDYESSVQSTVKLLNSDQATVFEAAVRFEELFVRVDVLRKTAANQFEIIEVKAKTIDLSEGDPFFTKRSPKKIVSGWEPYLLDIAFQTHVVRSAFPGSKTSSFLMLADKNAKSSIDGLNQKFRIDRTADGKSQTVTIRPGTTKDSCGDSVLVKVNVDEAVDYILNQMFGSLEAWKEHVRKFAKLVTKGERATPEISGECKTCEFRAGEEDLSPGQKSGFLDCWKEAAGLSASDYRNRPLSIDVGGFQAAKKALPAKRYFADQLGEDDFSGNEGSKAGLSQSQRQLLQVEFAKSKKHQVYLDQGGIKEEMSTWKYPLHFIDFETTTVALPFNKGRRPYETIAFQFSHHVVTAGGTCEHRGEYISRKRGEFPNFEFVRALKKSLEGDEGTIFRYSFHENTVLCHIHSQLEASQEPDRDELMAWIETVTTKTDKSKSKKKDSESEGWQGPRSMVDLCDLVKRYYWSPHMGGSASIKKVLPAVLKESKLLQEKYSAPVYGAKIKSTNFVNQTWIKRDEAGEILDPYKALPPIFATDDARAIEVMFAEDDIRNGGTAMMAYAKTQFTEMSEGEAQGIFDALLRYCELDTFAMVMIYEYWMDELRVGKRKVG